VRSQFIDLREAVEADRIRNRQRFEAAASDLGAWTTTTGAELPLHRFETELFGRLMALGCLSVALWWACRSLTSTPRVLRRWRASYLYRGCSNDHVRTRFGVLWLKRPVYDLVSGSGPAQVSPLDRRMGLAAGRMSLGVHLLIAWLVAQSTFDSAVAVLGKLSGYAPSKRSSLGIADSLGPVAAWFLEDLPAPDDDGDVLVISFDDKAAPMLRAAAHRKRCGPRKRLVLPGREDRRRRRVENRRPRRKKGDKKKNGRSAKVAVVYTLRRLPDGSVEGPINRRIFGTFGSRSDLVRRVRKEAVLRGYPEKRTLFLADGATTLWDIWRNHFGEAAPCLDWYHLSEYLWSAGGTVHREGTRVLAKWVRTRQLELRKGEVDAVIAAIDAARRKVGRGRGTKGRRKRVNDALRYIRNHREMLPYAELLADGLDIGTGVMEGAVKHAVAARLDGSGMQWSPRRAENVLALRLVLVNNLWSDFEDYAIERHEESDAWAVPRITPKGPQDIDPACLEAA
jgi:hypothetical protein